MERFVDLSLADIGRTVYRYRPVVAAAVAIMVLGLVLPGPRRLGQDLAQIATQPTSRTPTAAPSTVAPEAVAADTGAGVDAGASGVATSPAPSFDSSPSSSFGSSFSSSPSSVDSSRSSSSSSSSGTAGTEPARSSSPAIAEPSASTSRSPSRPVIVTTLYASRTAGTPLASNGVPANSLPVGKQLGQEDKVSFIRLSNAPDRLVLKANPAGDRSSATAAIQVCMVKTTGWSGGEAVAFSAAPERDCTVSVLGGRAEDGSWSFDLRPFEGRGGDGFSFAPAPGSPVDFQVAFEATLS